MKLPSWFRIDTPIGSYNPDWAFVTERDEKLYFVRETKSTLEVRPVFHHCDDTTIGHIVGCFLALRLEVDLQRRLDERGVDVAWPDLMRDLAELRAVYVTVDEQRYRLRTELRGKAAAALAAAGVRAPRVCEHLARL